MRPPKQDDDYDDDDNNTKTNVGMNLDKVESFQSQGYLSKVPFLSQDTCKKLREYINNDLETTLLKEERSAEDGEGEHEQEPSSSSSRLCNIRSRTNRWDLKLDLAPSTQQTALINAAMKELLENNNFLIEVLAPLLQCETDDVILVEFGCLISDPGAPAQDWHPDSAYDPDQKNNSDDDNNLLVCCFITLQDTPLCMGPTELIPYTHTKDFHKEAVRNFPPKGIMPKYATPKSMQSGYELAGEACVMDCRLYHRGGSNTYNANSNNNNTDSSPYDSDNDDDEAETSSSKIFINNGRRLVFYFTVRSRTGPRPGGSFYSIVKELDGKQLIGFL